MNTAFGHDIFRSRAGDTPDLDDIFDRLKNGGNGRGAYKEPSFPIMWDMLEQMSIFEFGLHPHHANWCEAIAQDFEVTKHFCTQIKMNELLY